MSSRSLLFTPGPLTTSATVKAAMQHDFGSRDAAFITIMAEIRRDLVALGSQHPELWTCVPMQGSGTFGLEGALGTPVRRAQDELAQAGCHYLAGSWAEIPNIVADINARMAAGERP